MPTPRSLRVNDYDMHYLEAGAGAPLLLVHGSLCDYRYWQPQMEPLARRHRIFAPSLRHYWPEAWDGRGAGFTRQQHAADLAAFIEAVGGGAPVDLLGHSRGGAVAYTVAQQHPRLVRTLILAEPGVAAGEREADPAMDRDNFRCRALELIRGGDRDGGLALFIDTVSGPGTWSRTVPWLKQMMRDNANTLFGQAFEPYATVDRAALAALPMPLLLIGGAQSPQPYPAVLDAMQQWAPHARRATIANASHAMNLWNPGEFNRAVLDFLSQ
jgi:pimeloyl-ACP methyl ester carboxylesterase